ncbi:O-linked N-acetylglucosamine transferase, SPINDLY family protein [Sphingomonas sp. SRS2]|uniref:O-linked N-acetylglucosamine transferase, SPINDLY family protein n=1 Tax=Sphingomonas sp. SRS2 TaxID=133190 RepID=UPI001F466648|nr:tetratricopeptide repeat protein [Sphingomonas sp. SRS2]
MAYNNLGNLLRGMYRYDEALDCYRRALAIAPDYAAARAHKLDLEAHICDWEGIAADRAGIPRLGVESAAVPPFMMFALDDHPARHRARSERLVAETYRATPMPPSPPLPRPPHMAGRLRIGYFSADFHNHATLYLMARLFELHDRDRFAVHAYSYGPDQDDEMRRRLRGAVEVFRDVRHLGDREVAELARGDAIDIAIDLKGYTTGTRSGIFAFRPAPVQINYLGYPGTMGADFIDYIIADPVVIPARLRGAYSEKIITLPYSYMASDDRRAIADGPVTRTDMALPENAFVFACFNNSYKISADVFDIWMRLLGKVEGSVLWLLRANRWAEANLANEAARRGIDPARLIFADKLPPAEHLARQRLADMFLDTFAFNAHTTASDALWGGLPIVTKLGESFSARVAGSLLNAVGLPDLITDDEGDYERLALDLATHPEKLAAIRARLAARRLTAPLFDSARHTRHVEQGYVEAYRRHAEGLAPDHIEIAP